MDKSQMTHVEQQRRRETVTQRTLLHIGGHFVKRLARGLATWRRLPYLAFHTVYVRDRARILKVAPTFVER